MPLRHPPDAEPKEPIATKLLAAAIVVVAASAVLPVALYLDGNRGARIREADASAVRVEPAIASAAPPPRASTPSPPASAPQSPASAPHATVAPVVSAAVAPAEADRKAAVADGPGFLTIHTTPRARVSEHGRVLCTATPCAHLALPPGAHTITLENKEESLKNSVTVSIASGATTTKRVTLKP